MSYTSAYVPQELTCKPLDSLDDIKEFLENPPPWRTLCEELRPHSKYKLKNGDINKDFNEDFTENPQTFCHFEPDVVDVKRQEEKSLPKTLVCHDMANGYHDDSVIDGTARYDAYTVYNWAGIDIFCYFSHHLITIPPLGWINVGHAHGVKVIGTVISEWSTGSAFWEEILKSEADWQNFASALVAIARTLKFDGWLMNVENNISKPKELLDFMQYLHKHLHQELNNPLLIWYDSVTVEGKLAWQNALNQHNRAFFDACDGIFTNYSWLEKDIESSAAVAGYRLTDVYIGIDVWGRNFFGGGEFNTKAAITLVHKHGCSLAIFAPAWTHEAMDEKTDGLADVAMSESLTKYERFLLRDRAFWGSIWPFLNTKLPSRLPFQTSFCRGQGKKRRNYGEVLCPGPWFNLRHMQYQPNSSHGPHGYLLSTLENIALFSRQGFSKDTNFIDECRRTFRNNKLNLPQTSSKSDLPENHMILENQIEVIQVNSEKKSKRVKRKNSNLNEDLYRNKSPKTDSDDKEMISQGQPQHNVVVQHNEKEQDILQKNIENDDLTRKSRAVASQTPAVQKSSKSKIVRYGLAYVAGELECLQVYFDDSFIGGSCLKVNPSDEVQQNHRTSRLFHCDFKCRDPLIAVVVTKTLPSYENQFLNMKLKVALNKGQETEVVLHGKRIPEHVFPREESRNNYYYPINSSPNFKIIQRYLLLNQSGFYIPVENAFGWRVWYYLIELPSGSRITSVNARTALPVGPILLGHFGICFKAKVSE